MNEPLAEYPQLFLDGIRYFNECEFFEAHESWEELWADEVGDSLQRHSAAAREECLILHR